MISLHSQALPQGCSVSEQPLEPYLGLLCPAEVLSEEAIAISAPVGIKQVFSCFDLDFPVAEDEVVFVVGVSAIGAVGIDEGFLAEVTKEGSRILAGNENWLGIEALLGECTNEL